MKYIIAILLAVLLVSASLASAPEKKPVREEQFMLKGKKRVYYLFAPASSTPLPLVVPLLGKGRDAKKAIEKWQELAARENFVVASPMALNRSGWSGVTESPEFFRALIESIKAKCAINTQKIYLFGHKESATMAIALGLIESEYYAAVVSYFGSLDTFSYHLIERAKRKIPVGMLIGRDDPFFPLETIKATRDALNARNFPVEIVQIPGHDNDYNRGFDLVNRAAWDFFKAYQLP
ncbi:MAG TPA: dienelactone hydrolase family protein [Blastocatellia bacterium]|jgi:poly(3-hydroxybutyrate) depolymerase